MLTHQILVFHVPQDHCLCSDHSCSCPSKRDVGTVGMDQTGPSVDQDTFHTIISLMFSSFVPIEKRRHVGTQDRITDRIVLSLSLSTIRYPCSILLLYKYTCSAAAAGGRQISECGEWSMLLAAPGGYSGVPLPLVFRICRVSFFYFVINQSHW